MTTLDDARRAALDFDRRWWALRMVMGTTVAEVEANLCGGIFAPPCLHREHSDIRTDARDRDSMVRDVLSGGG